MLSAQVRSCQSFKSGLTMHLKLFAAQRCHETHTKVHVRCVKLKLDDLEIYSRSLSLAVEVRSIVRNWNSEDRSTLGRQLVRACDSVPSNIAEGYGRFSTADQKKFLHIARASMYEARTQLLIAKKTGLVPHDIEDRVVDESEQLIRMLIAFTVRSKKRKM